MNNLNNDIYSKVSEELGIPKHDVERIYKAYFLFIKETLTSLDIKDNMTEEEFKQQRTTIRIPYLGMMGVTWSKYLRVQEQGRKIANHKKKKNENKEDNTSV